MRSWKYTFRSYSLFVSSLQLFMFPVLPSSYCLPIFFVPVFLKPPLTWSSPFSELPGLIRDPPHWDLCCPPIPAIFQSFCGHRNISPAFLSDPYSPRCLSATSSLSWSFREMSWLCHDSHLVGCRSGTRCALPSSVSQVRPSPFVPYSGTAVSLCLGQVAFSSAVITLLSCLFSSPFHST